MDKNCKTVADLVADLLVTLAPGRIFALQGGHIQPIWDRAASRGLNFVDVRHEGAAVHMAQAYGELTGCPGLAMATAGPGVANTVTAIANAHSARTPLLLIGGAPPRPQLGGGALQELPQVEMLRPITRYAATVMEESETVAHFVKALARARGDGGDPGPAYLEFPTDVLRGAWPSGAEARLPEPPPAAQPDGDAVTRAADALRRAERPLVISGRGSRGTDEELARLLAACGGAYLDTQESRGLVVADHPAYVGALRGKAMAEADLVILVGRRLDYQLAYGSPAVFAAAHFLRLSDAPGDLSPALPNALDIVAPPKLALLALLEELGEAPRSADWRDVLRAEHERRVDRLRREMTVAAPGSDGFMHPYRLLGALQSILDDDAVFIADGGDILSFARIAVSARTYLDSGVLGCLGVGVPFGIAAALARPEATVVSLSGDGAFGFNAMEIDTAARHGAKAVFVVANNGAWNIERYDQLTNYEGRVNGAELAFSDYAAMARGFGLHAERVLDPDELPGALERAQAKAPALLDVVVTRDAVSPDGRSGLAVVPDFQALAAWDKLERDWRNEESKG